LQTARLAQTVSTWTTADVHKVNETAPQCDLSFDGDQGAQTSEP